MAGDIHLGIMGDRQRAARIPEAERCPRCEGSGNELYAMYRRCTACSGTGRWTVPAEHEQWRSHLAGTHTGERRKAYASCRCGWGSPPTLEPEQAWRAHVAEVLRGS